MVKTQGSGGSASPEALASMDSKIEQIMAHLAYSSKPDLPSADDYGFSQEHTRFTRCKGIICEFRLKIDKILCSRTG